MAKDFVKQEDAEFSVQLKAFGDGVGSTSPPNGATVGLTPAEITEAQKDAAYVKYVLEELEKSKGFSQSFTKYKNDLRYSSVNPIIVPSYEVPATIPAVVPAGVEKRFRDKAAKVKISPNYTAGIGEAWRIVAPVETVVIEVPEFYIEFVAGRPVLNWKKKNSDGCEVWKDKGAGWYHAGNDTKSPYIDKDDLPAAGTSAVWKFKIIYLKNDEQIGGFSAVITITVSSDATGSRGIVN
jgi:hypothetical protein